MRLPLLHYSKSLTIGATSALFILTNQSSLEFFRLSILPVQMNDLKIFAYLLEWLSGSYCISIGTIFRKVKHMLTYMITYIYICGVCVLTLTITYRKYTDACCCHTVDKHTYWLIDSSSAVKFYQCFPLWNSPGQIMDHDIYFLLVFRHGA